MARSPSPSPDREFTRVAQLMQRDDAVFVFGSNRRGSHGGGAAREANEKYGAKWGRGEGHYGRSYALPTMDIHLRQLPIADVFLHVLRFLEYARATPHHTFAVTKVGCGIAGFQEEEIRPLFAGAPEHCELPEGWR